MEFILDQSKAEVTQRFRTGDLPTQDQAALQFFNFGRTTATQSSFEIWNDIVLAMKNMKPSAKVCALSCSIGVFFESVVTSRNPCLFMKVELFLSHSVVLFGLPSEVKMTSHRSQMISRTSDASSSR